MGLFTYRQAKKTKQEVQKLRQQQANDAAAQQLAEQFQAQRDRDQALFQQLPPEGKEEFRAAQATFREQYQSLGTWKRNGKAGRQAHTAFVTAKVAIFRRYDLIP